MEWDEYYLKICRTVGSNSKCHSRQIGAILVKDNRIISTGYNGPPMGVPECRERYKHDHEVQQYLAGQLITQQQINKAHEDKLCPRKLMNFPSGEGLEWCCAIHAEKNCLLAAAMRGVPTKGATMYIDAKISPCTQCLGACVNAGIKEIVLIENNIYDPTVKWVANNADILIREYKM